MLSGIDQREERRSRARWRARHALMVDMGKSYAGPLLLAAFINPILSADDGAAGLAAPNYLLLLIGLAMLIAALIFVPAASE